MYHETGERYCGELHARDGRLPNPHGKGTMYNRNGVNVYIGEYRQAEKYGQGTVFYSNGSPHYEGYFEFDQILEGLIYRKSGEVEYKGTIENGVPHGEGTFYFPGGRSLFSGEFDQGFFNGKGTERVQCGRMDRVIEGVWKDGKMVEALGEKLIRRNHDDWINVDGPAPSNNAWWPEDPAECALRIQLEFRRYFSRRMDNLVFIQYFWRQYVVRKERQRALARKKKLKALKQVLLPAEAMNKMEKKATTGELISSNMALADLMSAGNEEEPDAMEDEDAPVAVEDEDKPGAIEDEDEPSAIEDEEVLGAVEGEEVPGAVEDEDEPVAAVDEEEEPIASSSSTNSTYVP